NRFTSSKINCTYRHHFAAFSRKPPYCSYARPICVKQSNSVPTAQTCKYDSTHGNWKLHLSVRQAACHGYRQLSTPPCSIEANPLRFRVPSLLYQCANPPTDSLLSAVSV